MRKFFIAIVGIALASYAAVHGAAAAEDDNLNRLFSQFDRQFRAGKYREAESTARELVSSSRTDAWKASSYNWLGQTLWMRAHYAEAIEAYTQAKSYPLLPLDINSGWIPNNLGLAYLAQRKYPDATRFLNKARAAFDRIRPGGTEMATVCSNLGNLYMTLGQNTEAESFYRQALTIREKLLPPDDPDLADAIYDLGIVCYRQGRYADAEPLCQRTLVILETIYKPDHVWTRDCRHWLGKLYCEMNRRTNAEQLFRNAIRKQEEVLGPDHIAVAHSLIELASLCHDTLRHAEAEQLYKRALRILEEKHGPNHPDVAWTLRALAIVYSKLSRDPEADPIIDRAVAIMDKATDIGNTDLVQFMLPFS